MEMKEAFGGPLRLLRVVEAVQRVTGVWLVSRVHRGELYMGTSQQSHPKAPRLDSNHPKRLEPSQVDRHK